MRRNGARQRDFRLVLAIGWKLTLAPCGRELERPARRVTTPSFDDPPCLSHDASPERRRTRSASTCRRCSREAPVHARSARWIECCRRRSRKRHERKTRLVAHRGRETRKDRRARTQAPRLGSTTRGRGRRRAGLGANIASLRDRTATSSRARYRPVGCDCLGTPRSRHVHVGAVTRSPPCESALGGEAPAEPRLLSTRRNASLLLGAPASNSQTGSAGRTRARCASRDLLCDRADRTAGRQFRVPWRGRSSTFYQGRVGGYRVPLYAARRRVPRRAGRRSRRSRRSRKSGARSVPRRHVAATALGPHAPKLATRRHRPGRSRDEVRTLALRVVRAARRARLRHRRSARGRGWGRDTRGLTSFCTTAFRPTSTRSSSAKPRPAAVRIGCLSEPRRGTSIARTTWS